MAGVDEKPQPFCADEELERMIVQVSRSGPVHRHTAWPYCAVGPGAAASKAMVWLQLTGWTRSNGTAAYSLAYQRKAQAASLPILTCCPQRSPSRMANLLRCSVRGPTAWLDTGSRFELCCSAMHSLLQFLLRQVHRSAGYRKLLRVLRL